MTASVKNAMSALRVLREGLTELGYERLDHVANVVEKCMKSLCDQVAFYEGEKSPLKADGLAGLTPHTFTCPATGAQHTVFAYPEGIAVVEAALQQAKPLTGAEIARGFSAELEGQLEGVQSDLSDDPSPEPEGGEK